MHKVLKSNVAECAIGVIYHFRWASENFNHGFAGGVEVFQEVGENQLP